MSVTSLYVMFFAQFFNTEQNKIQMSKKEEMYHMCSYCEVHFQTYAPSFCLDNYTFLTQGRIFCPGQRLFCPGQKLFFIWEKIILSGQKDGALVSWSLFYLQYKIFGIQSYSWRIFLIPTTAWDNCEIAMGQVECGKLK